jgi:hypothetical protein
MGQSRAVLSSEAVRTQRPSGAILALRKSFSANKLGFKIVEDGLKLFGQKPTLIIAIIAAIMYNRMVSKL